ncbi:MAG: ankyrin repeat domain-containing protein, partial [Treponema sp.]|nr:ankyrin repeat domain-containing protein [Treponema sp.]
EIEFQGLPLLFIAISFKALKTIRLLLDKGANPNKTDRNGNSALIFACIKNYTDIAKILIEKGADTNFKTSQNLTPLVISLLNNNKELIDILTQANTSADSLKPADESLPLNEKLNLYISKYTAIDNHSASDIWKNCEMDRKTFSKIRNNNSPECHPKKKNVILLAIGLRLSISETNSLLQSAGYSFSSENKKDQIIKKCIENKKFTTFDINQALYESLQITLDEY